MGKYKVIDTECSICSKQGQTDGIGLVFYYRAYYLAGRYYTFNCNICGQFNSKPDRPGLLELLKGTGVLFMEISKRYDDQPLTRNHLADFIIELQLSQYPITELVGANESK